jgi:hypothetical protein
MTSHSEDIMPHIREVQPEYRHACDTDGCGKTFKNGDPCIQDARPSGWSYFYCTMKCAEKNRLEFPDKIVWITTATTCGSSSCGNKLEEGVEYVRAVGVCSLCCCDECATDQFNRVWGQFEGDKAEAIEQQGRDDDYWHYRRRKHN